MKYLLKFIVLLIIFTGLFILLQKYFSQNNSTAQISNDHNQAIQKTDQKKFLWGVHTNPYVFNQPGDNFIPSHLAKQIPFWENLGINIIRFNFEHNLHQPSTDANDAILETIESSNLIPYMIVSHPFTDLQKEATYQKGYDWGYQIAKKYQGRVKYYQLDNEVSGTVIKPNRSGLKWEDFDPDRYEPFKNYLLGLSNGIKDGDPNAKRVITAHWLGVAIIDKLYEDKLPFEVIGWNWYSEMGDDPTSKKLDDGTTLNIPGHFSYMNKDFWMVETNRSGGDFGEKGELKQAEYIKNLTQNILRSNDISGFFIFKLFDSQSADGGIKSKDNSLGLIADTKSDDGSYSPGKVKQTYLTYKQIIQKNLYNSN